MSFNRLTKQYKKYEKKCSIILVAVFFFFAGTSFTLSDRTQPAGSESAQYITDDININDSGSVSAVNEASSQVISYDSPGSISVSEDGGENIDELYSASDLVSDIEVYSESVKLEPSDTSDIGFSRDDWNLILINKTHPIPAGYELNLGVIKDNLYADVRIIPDLLEMLKAAQSDGVRLMICSPYRDTHKQESLFEKKIKEYSRKGNSYFDAYRLSAQTVTIPGASEHEIGLALDIVCATHQSLNAAFGDTKEGQWLQSHSYEYGFILRYPKGKEEITGIEYEPWHFRYVGVRAAKVIYESDITLEEFCQSLY